MWHDVDTKSFAQSLPSPAGKHEAAGLVFIFPKDSSWMNLQGDAGRVQLSHLSSELGWVFLGLALLFASVCWKSSGDIIDC